MIIVYFYFINTKYMRLIKDMYMIIKYKTGMWLWYGNIGCMYIELYQNNKKQLIKRWQNVLFKSGLGEYESSLEKNSKIMMTSDRDSHFIFKSQFKK